MNTRLTGDWPSADAGELKSNQLVNNSSPSFRFLWSCRFCVTWGPCGFLGRDACSTTNPWLPFLCTCPRSSGRSETAETGTCQQHLTRLTQRRFRRSRTHQTPPPCGRWCSVRTPPSSPGPQSGAGRGLSPENREAGSPPAPWTSRPSEPGWGPRRWSGGKSETWWTIVCGETERRRRSKIYLVTIFLWFNWWPRFLLEWTQTQ